MDRNRVSATRRRWMSLATLVVLAAGCGDGPAGAGVEAEKVSGTNGTVELQIISCTLLTQLAAKHVPGLLHQFVAVAATLEHAGF